MFFIKEYPSHIILKNVCEGIFLSEKLIVALICLLIALLFIKSENFTLGDAEARLVSRMMKSEKLVEVFNLDSETVFL